MVKSSMEQNERYDAAVGPVDSEGGHSPSALSTGQADPASGVARIGPLAPGQRWSVGRKREAVLRLRDADPASTELAAAMQRIGELSMEVELLRANAGRPGPLARRRSR
jgi:transposase